MFKRFSHYLSYGATDQHTVRELTGSFDGLLVPGTVGAFQRAGTGGFVLTLSATAAAPDYVIDPRFPLFQQALTQPKQSHLALADLLGDPNLINSSTPIPDQFSSVRIEGIARRWVEFNEGYTGEARQKFDKYAARLQEPVEPSGVRPPQYILPPYVAADGPRDPWWQVSLRLFQASASASSLPCARVVAAKSPEVLSALLADVVDDPQVCVWVSRLEELELPSDRLAAYGAALSYSASRGQQVFALYGGFFSVLLSAVGLGGSSHGIGFAESRDWVELPQSGPPPARYYLKPLHRYVSIEFAYELWLRDRPLVQCDCPECNGGPPIGLEYHSLMKHSVLCRADEIATWVGMDLQGMVATLRQEAGRFRSAIDDLRIPSYLIRQAERSWQHLPRWIDALSLLLQG